MTISLSLMLVLILLLELIGSYGYTGYSKDFILTYFSFFDYSCTGFLEEDLTILSRLVKAFLGDFFRLVVSFTASSFIGLLRV